MVKAYFAACEQAFPAQRAQLRRLALALGRGGVDTMEQLCALQRAGPKGLLAIRSIGEKSLPLIAAVCARYEENRTTSQGGTPLAADRSLSAAGMPSCPSKRRNRMKKRILSILTVLALCLGLLPTAAFAADGDKAIMLGTNGISGYDDNTNSYDYIYFGNWEAPDEYTTTGPIKWRVLDDQTNTGGDGLFLLSDVLFGKGNKYGGGVCFNQDRSSNVWQGSAAQKWCQDFYGSSFSTGEQGAVLATTKTDAAYKATSVRPPIDFLGSELKGDTVFFLSAEEVESSAYGFINNAARLAYFGNTGNWGAWWLRSPDKLNSAVAGTITRGSGDLSGSLNGNYVDNYSYSARPAFNLNLNSVLFTSAAVGGKSATGMDSGLTAVGAYDGSEWKLTLLDSSRNFGVTETDISGDPGDTITLHYTGATTGDNEYISVILAAESSVQYYGRIAKATTAEGEISLTIPDTLAEGTYTLNVFNERCNGDYKTDYASAFETFTLTVDITAPTLSNGSATRDSETSATVKFTSDEAGTYYYVVAESGAETPDIDTTGAGTSCDTTEQTISLDNLTGAGAKDIYIVAKDAAGNISQPLKIEIPAYIAPVYDISADTQSLDFGTVTEGYEAPAEQTVTIANAGNQPQTLTQPASTSSFEVGTLSKAELPVGETVTFTVRPKAGLPVGSYSENIVVSGLENTTVSVTANFTVKQFSSGGGTTTYPVQVEENSQNGGVQVSPKNAVPGTLVTVTPQPAPGYELATLSVLDQYGNEVDVNPLGNGNYSFKMPRSGVKVEATFYCTGSELCPTHHLSDVLVKAWYHDAVDHVVEHGIMTGTSATTFEPNTTLSRAMVAQILYNLEGQPDISEENLGYPYSDVDAEVWYGDAVYWARLNGVATGYEDNTFRPDKAVTREELAQMLYNYAQYKGITLPALGDLSKFLDGDKVSSWARTAMSWATGLGVINGYEDSTLEPGGDSTRAQAASILMNFDVNLVEE